MLLLLAAIGLPGLALSAANATTVCVDGRALGAANGLSWADAYTNVQDALSAASQAGSPITEIRVAAGTFRPDHGIGQTAGNRSASFSVPSGIAVRGGYRGVGPGGSPDDRDIQLFATILSGDLAGDDGPNYTNYGDNSYHVVRLSNASASTVLDGLTVTSGNSAGDTTGYGAGILSLSSSPQLLDCTVRRCIGPGGCGIMFNQGDPRLLRCSIVENSGYPGSGAVGAGIWAVDGTLELRECNFLRNTGLMITAKGAGLYRLRGTTLIDRCAFLGNTVQATQGGAIYFSAASSVVTNSAFVGNKASDLGGAIYVYQGQATLDNCTIASNGLFQIVNGSNGGVLVHGGGVLNVTNCILWDNRPSFGSPTQASQIGFATSPASTLNISYSCVQGWTGSLGGTHNHGLNPAFADFTGPDGVPGSGDENLRLTSGSPCVDAGSNAAVPFGSGIDLDGANRFVDDPATPNNGTGLSPLVDMGAYELQACYANCDNSTQSPVLTANDFQCFLNRFAAGDPLANCDGSSALPVLTANDFQCFLNRFAQGCP